MGIMFSKSVRTVNFCPNVHNCRESHVKINDGNVGNRVVHDIL